MEIYYSQHAKDRMTQKGIVAPDVEEVLKQPITQLKQANGRIKVIGKLSNGNRLVVVYKQVQKKIIIVTTHL